MWNEIMSVFWKYDRQNDREIQPKTCNLVNFDENALLNNGNGRIERKNQKKPN